MILGILAVTVAIVLFFLEPRRLRKHTLSQAYKTLQQVLKENKEHLLNNEDPLTKKKEFEEDCYIENRGLSNPIKICYSLVYLNNSSYQSLFQSGFFTHFSSDIQRKISTLDHTIRLRNETMTYLDQYGDLFFLIYPDKNTTNQEYINITDKYKKAIVDWNKEIIKLIDELKELLKDEEKNLKWYKI